MTKPWKKYLDAFKNLDQIAEGIKNKSNKKISDFKNNAKKNK